MPMLKILTGLLVALLVLAAGYIAYLRLVTNPEVIAQLKTPDGGPRADKVMLVTLPDGQELPVNYLREEGMVYVGVDGLWWRQFSEGPQPVKLVIKGEPYVGTGVAVLDDPEHTADVFARLRPTAPTWLPGRMKGVLLEITLAAENNVLGEGARQ